MLTLGARAPNLNVTGWGAAASMSAIPTPGVGRRIVIVAYRFATTTTGTIRLEDSAAVWQWDGSMNPNIDSSLSADGGLLYFPENEPVMIHNVSTVIVRWNFTYRIEIL